MSNSETTIAPPPSGTASFEFEVTDVTGSHDLFVSDCDPRSLVGSISRTLAARMLLPETVPWALRNDRTSEPLIDDEPIGDQIAPLGEHLTISPRTHLG